MKPEEIFQAILDKANLQQQNPNLLQFLKQVKGGLINLDAYTSAVQMLENQSNIPDEIKIISKCELIHAIYKQEYKTYNERLEIYKQEHTGHHQVTNLIALFMQTLLFNTHVQNMIVQHRSILRPLFNEVAAEKSTRSFIPPMRLSRILMTLSQYHDNPYLLTQLIHNITQQGFEKFHKRHPSLVQSLLTKKAKSATQIKAASR